MSNIISFAILGTGVAAEIHAKAINSLGNARLAGVFSTNDNDAKAFSEKYNTKRYKSYAELLGDDNIHAVCICTPSGLHADHAIDALNHGKHVVVEKPIALSEKDADRIAKAVSESGCILTVISQLRFSDDVKKVKELYDKNAFGKITNVSLYMKYWRSEEYYKTGGWHGTKAMDGGGALMNQGIHGIDLLLYITGGVKLLYGKAKTCYHNIEVEDMAVAAIETENGALGVIEASTCTFPGFDRRVEISGSNGCVILDNGNIKKLVIDGKEISLPETAKIISSAHDPRKTGYELHARQIADFIAAIHEEKSLEVDIYDGKKAVSLIEAIYKFSDSVS